MEPSKRLVCAAWEAPDIPRHALRHWVGSFGGPGLQALRNELVGYTRRTGCVLRRSTSVPGVQCATRVEAARPTGLDRFALLLLAGQGLCPSRYHRPVSG